MPIDNVDLTLAEVGLQTVVTGEILNGYGNFLSVFGEVTSGSSVAYGDITFTPNYSGEDSRFIPILTTEDTTDVITISGVTNVNCKLSHYLDSRTYGNNSGGGGSVAVDKTLTLRNSAADAKTVGDALYDDAALPNGWTAKGINSTTGSDVSAQNRLTSMEFNNVGLSCGSDYSFYVCAWQNGTYAGAIRTNGLISTSGTLAWLKTINLTAYSGYTYRIVLKKDDDSTLTVGDAHAVKFWRVFDKNYPVVGGMSDLDFKTATDRNLCLCALKTEILTNKIPFHSGYLFHKVGSNDDGTLLYGDDLEHIKRIGQVPFLPSDYVLAMSPTDGRVIAAQRDSRTGLWVWDGETCIKVLGSATVKPQGWLYNSGVDFIKDGNGLEHCVFAEYNGSGGDGFYVWHGTYPYTSDSDWEHVMYVPFSIQSSATDAITHFHQIRRDPWTNILYLTSGDRDWQLKWWYSTDFGATWTLLTDNSTNGWEAGTGRCINFVFTEDYIYWATDSQGSHTLNRIERGSNGVIDPATRYKICNLPNGQASNSICYMDTPKGLFMYDRIGESGALGGQGFDVQWYDLQTNELKTIMHIFLTTNSWGGHRGKCYINYTSGAQPYPAMGFAGNTPCVFDVAYSDVSKIGTVYYDVVAELMKFVLWR